MATGMVFLVLAVISQAKAMETNELVNVTNATLKVEFTLEDGSRLIGTLADSALPFSLNFQQSLSLPIETLSSLEFDHSKEKAVVSFINGDRLTGCMDKQVLEVTSLAGTFQLQAGIINKILFLQQKKGPPKGLLYWNTFDSEEQIRQPAVGPKSVLNHGRIVEGKHGNALHTQGRMDAMSFVFPPYTLKKEGTVEFWAKMDVGNTSFGDGANPRFFRLSVVDGSGVTRLEFSRNNGLGAGGLCSITQNLSCGTTRFSDGLSRGASYREILGSDYNGWHHYALVWNTEGLLLPGRENQESLAIYLDGKLVSTQIQRGAPLDMKSLTTTWETRFVVAPSFLAPKNTIPFAIDELKIWDHAKTGFDLQHQK